MRTSYFILLMSCLFFLPASAQKKDKCNETEFRAKKQAYMAKKAHLTQEETGKFFTHYFEFQDKKKEINIEAWGNAKKGIKPETSEEQYEEIIDNYFDEQERIDRLEKEYIKRYREILSNKKIYMLYWAEFKFSRNMLKILQEIDDTKNKGL